MDNLSLMDFQDLCNLILSGEKSIQDTIDVYNNRRDVLNKLSFLNHLLCYKNIHKDNLLQVLHKIYLMFQIRIKELSSNPNIGQMLERNNQEWYLDTSGISLEDPLYDDFLDNHDECKEKYDVACRICVNIDKLVESEENISIDAELETAHPLETNFNEGISSCEESSQYITSIIQEIEEKLIKYFKNFDINQLIDLSMKHKSLYLSLIEKEDPTIPENIHIIFSNFLYIHSLLNKQVIQYYNHLLKIKDDITKKCDKIKNLKENLQTIAYIEPQEKEKINFYSDNEESDDSEDYDKEKYNPYVKPKQVEDEKNKVGTQDEQEEDIIERLFRRFLN